MRQAGGHPPSHEVDPRSRDDPSTGLRVAPPLAGLIGSAASPAPARYTKGLHEYDLIAEWYASTRGVGGAGVPEVASLAASLGAGAFVLDAGCGTGLPLTRVLLEHRCRPIGLDSSAAMLAHFRRNVPGVPAVRGRLQACPLADRTLHAVVAWGVMFHLDHREQREAVAEVARVLRSGGLFLFTSGDEHGSKDGEPMHGVPFRYHSFRPDGYLSMLAERGLVLEDVHADAGANTHYRARKRTCV